MMVSISVRLCSRRWSALDRGFFFMLDRGLVINRRVPCTFRYYIQEHPDYPVVIRYKVIRLSQLSGQE